MKRIIPIAIVALAVSLSVLAQGGRRGAPPPPSALEPGASQADVDKALLPLPPRCAIRRPSSNGRPTSPTTR